MADNSKMFSEILSKADPKTIKAIKQMAQSGQFDELKSKLGSMDKKELLNSLKGFDKESLENTLGKLGLKDIVNNPSVKQVADDLSKNKKLQDDIKTLFNK